MCCVFFYSSVHTFAYLRMFRLLIHPPFYRLMRSSALSSVDSSIYSSIYAPIHWSVRLPGSPIHHIRSCRYPSIRLCIHYLCMSFSVRPLVRFGHLSVHSCIRSSLNSCIHPHICLPTHLFMH